EDKPVVPAKDSLPDTSAVPKSPEPQVRGLALSAPEHELREKFLAAFGAIGPDLIRQVETMVEKALARITRSRAFFRDRDVIREVMHKSRHAITNDEILEHPSFPDLVK